MRVSWHARLAAALIVTASLAPISGCKNEPDMGASPTGVREPEHIRDTRREYRTQLPRIVQEHVERAVSDDALAAVLDEESTEGSLKWRDALRTFYASRSGAHVFYDGDGLTSAALAFIDEAAEAGTHLLQPRKYLREALTDALELAQESRAACAQLQTVSPDDAFNESLEAALAELVEHDAADAREFVWEQLIGQQGDFADAVAAARQLHRACAGADALLEATFADSVADYLFDLRAANWMTDNLEAGPRERERIVDERMQSLLTEYADAESDVERASFYASLVPENPQYHRLLDAHARYAEIVANGGWEEIEPTSLARGSSGSRVEALKTRLQIEGYYDGAIDQTFDTALEDAVKSYQESHQMEVTGRSSRGFWTSINISAEARRAQIELTVDRWRESPTIGEETYFLASIPDFHAELWHQGELLRRFRIVVGNTQRECRRGKLRYVNATPMQTANMSYVVLNPTWTVPTRILREELLPLQLEDPEFFESRGYEQITLESGAVMMRQAPGDGNALGRVKFIFPNEHDIYMHDTPRRGYFNFPVRAFSHGCMRVHEPMDLLEDLLTLDGQYDAAEVNRILEHGRERRINLNTPIPVHTEYYVVRVDDDGRVHFNADIYRHDRARLDPRFEREEDCTAQAQAAPRLVLTEDGEILMRGDDGELVDPNAEPEPAEPDEETADFDGVASPIQLPGDFGP